MKKWIRYAEKKGAEYVEISSVEGRGTTIELYNGKIRELSSRFKVGYGVRVLYKSKFGNAFSNKEEIKNLIDKAIKNSKVMEKRSEIASCKAVKKRFYTKFKINPEDVDYERKIKDLVYVDKLRKDYRKVNTLKISYFDGTVNHRFINSEGSELFVRDIYTVFVAWAFAKTRNKLENFMEIERGRCGYELMKKSEETARYAMSKAEELLRAKHAKGGIFDVILDQKLGGVFTHEAVGHACEADLVLNNSSSFSKKLGEKIGSDIVNIVDDGNLREWGWTPFDSEGVLAKKTYLVKKGVLLNFLHSRETSKVFGAEPSGNGRNDSLANKIIPRMTNTYIENGDSNFEEMLSEIKNGYYLKGSAGGQVDTAGGDFLFNAKEGYIIKNGELNGIVKGVSLLGNILETLKNIRLIGNDLKFSGGTCGKSSQGVPISCGSPHILIEKAKVGGL